MNFKKFINDNLWETDHHDQPSQSTQKTAAPRPSTPSTWLNSDGVTQAPVTTGVTVDLPSAPLSASPSVLDGARKHFQNSLKELHARLNTPDYFVFITAKNAMNSIPVESERYRMAFLSLSAVGLTKDVILQTAQQYIQAVDNELQGFASSYDPQFKQQVEDKKAAIEQKAQQMRDLNNQIQQLNEEIKQMNDEVMQNETSLGSAKQAFERAGQEAKEEIASEVQKITGYIQQ